MIEAIKSSRFYRTSKNQDKIIPILSSAFGAELVQQLSDYLDDPRVVTKEEYEANLESQSAAPADDTEGAPNDDGGDTADTGSSRSAPASHSSPAAPASFTPSANSDFESDIEDSNDADSEVTPEADEPDEGVESTDSSTTIPAASHTVFASHGHRLSDTYLSGIVTELQGLLNLHADTTGVSRVRANADTNEVWIFYNDSVNLNNIMDAVIDLLNAAGYTQLAFNRLARSDNAMVFDISYVDTNNRVRPSSYVGK